MTGFHEGRVAVALAIAAAAAFVVVTAIAVLDRGWRLKP
jgi:hypothetical protein